MDTITKYILAFQKLRIDTAHDGEAPHKPILLLSILQTFQNGGNFTHKIYITPELVAMYKSNWSLLVISNHTCQFALPFYHLTSSKFWHLIPKKGFESLVQIKTTMRSFGNLNAAIDYAIIEDELFSLMMDPKSNKILQEVLLDRYFPLTKNNFISSDLGKQKLFNDIEGKILNENAEEYKIEIKKLMAQKNEEEIYLRSSLFKREIPKIYNNTCCISGMRIDATISVSMIDACHIVPFSESFDDTIGNGISLCPNLHRAFDRGLISIDDDFRVMVSNVFREDEKNYGIRKFENKQINLPKEKQYFPLMNNLKWHRTNIFKTI